MKRKSQNWVETQVTDKSSLQELTLGNKSQNLTQKQISKFSGLVQFCLVFLILQEILWNFHLR